MPHVGEKEIHTTLCEQSTIWMIIQESRQLWWGNNSLWNCRSVNTIFKRNNFRLFNSSSEGLPDTMFLYRCFTPIYPTPVFLIKLRFYYQPKHFYFVLCMPQSLQLSRKGCIQITHLSGLQGFCRYPSVPFGWKGTPYNKVHLAKYASSRSVAWKLELPAVNAIHDKRMLKQATGDCTVIWELFSWRFSEAKHCICQKVICWKVLFASWWS